MLNSSCKESSLYRVDVFLERYMQIKLYLKSTWEFVLQVKPLGNQESLDNMETKQNKQNTKSSIWQA